MEKNLCIERLVNFPIDSNCYLLTTTDSNEYIVVDPSLADAVQFYQAQNSKGLKLKYIILTHEHFDHIGSVEYLRKESGCNVVATSDCSERITHPKKNLSLFYDQVGFDCKPADILITPDNLILEWAQYQLQFYLTPGHTNGSICFSITNHLFTGDTMIKEQNTIVKLPGGNSDKLKDSLKMIFEKFEGETIVYPGHGEIFNLSEYHITV